MSTCLSGYSIWISLNAHSTDQVVGFSFSFLFDHPLSTLFQSMDLLGSHRKYSRFVRYFAILDLEGLALHLVIQNNLLQILFFTMRG
jgi:hypothetical protein